MAFPSVENVQKTLEPIATYIADPFCNAANSGNREAYFLVLVTDVHKVSAYSCETQEMSPWINWDDLGNGDSQQKF